MTIKIIEVRVDPDGWAQDWVSVDGREPVPSGPRRHECALLWTDSDLDDGSTATCPTCSATLEVSYGMWLPS